MKYEHEFDKNLARIDNHGQYYYYTNGYFIRFYNGSMVCTVRATDPDDRRYYPDVGITLEASSGTGTKMYTEAGEPILRAWLGIPKIQYYLIDHSKNIVVSTHGGDLSLRQYIPGPLRGHSVYWASEDALPIGQTMRYSKPVVLTPDEKAYYTEARAAAMFMAKLNPPHFVNELKIKDLREAMRSNMVPSAYVAGLSGPEVKCLAENRKCFDREKIYTRFLYTEVPK